MRYKVLYISTIFLFAILCSGYSQKVSLILLPSGSTEIYTYDVKTDESNPTEQTISGYSKEVIQITPKRGQHKNSSQIKKQRLCKIIGSFCTQKWSDGLIKLFRLPSASGITL